ncbi:hypothetical protein MA20_42930 [Bradyrhizobium japonicum]|uniref:Uncharacterized protein n=2 Tax=Bradyrhizobium japonicum TaxID=375 RepID=A0A0A3XHB8_BRAJP|nr:hypothetical protein MA20_42930 [Bradyrhizobium japonicum]
MKAFSPTGSEIVATADLIPGNAWCEITGRNPDGSLEFNHMDETKVCWDGQHTTTDARGKSLFVAHDGTEWPEDSISLEGEALRPMPAPDAASPLTEPERQHLLMAVESSLRHARAAADGAWIPRWEALADRLKAHTPPAAPSWESIAETHRDAMRAEMTTDDGTQNEALARAADAVASAIKAYAALLPPGAAAPSVAPSGVTVWTLTTDGDNMGIGTEAFATEAKALAAAREAADWL